MISALRTALNHITKPERILIDASHTCASGKNSGIERVVRNILGECTRWCPSVGLPVPQLVVHEAGRFYPVEKGIQERFANLASFEANAQKSLPSWYLHVARGLCETSRSRKLQQWLLPQGGHLGAFKLFHSAFDRWTRKSLPWQSNSIEPNDRDLILLPDAYWTKRGVWEAAQHARDAGATVATVVYDLIPLTHPQYVGPKRSIGFERYMRNVVQHSDLVSAISQTVRNDVQAFIDRHRGELEQVPSKLDHFMLGAQLNLVSGTVRPSITELFPAQASAQQESTPYLMVATFDPRKNHTYLLDAFDLLWNAKSDARLVLVGRVGSLCEDIMHRIRCHPMLGKQLFAFHDLKDSELQHCYQHCRGVIFPSIVEGFGLPIVESLWFGKRTFASNTPIHREVGGSDCVYFDLDSPQSLCKLVQEWESSSERDAKLPTRRPTTWEESSQQLISQCLSIHHELRHRSALLPFAA